MTKKVRTKKYLKRGLIILVILSTVLPVLFPLFANGQDYYTPGTVSKEGYQSSMHNQAGSYDLLFIDAQDPPYMNGDFINQLLDRYPNSVLRGYGHTIKQLADKWGINTGFYLGIIARETTFGSAPCGGQYNFGCLMYSDWMSDYGVGSKWTNDRYWADPRSVEQGIELQMILMRKYYADQGVTLYSNFVDKYAPSFENNHWEVKSLFYAVNKALGQPEIENNFKYPQVSY